MEEILSSTEFQEIFLQLKSIFKQYEDEMVILSDVEGKYYLKAGYSEKWKKDVWFGGVQTMKNYVSFHFIPVYMFPELADDLSEEVKKRLGKGCFTFKKIDDKTIKELKGLVKKGYKKFLHESLINKSVSVVK